MGGRVSDWFVGCAVLLAVLGIGSPAAGAAVLPAGSGRTTAAEAARRAGEAHADSNGYQFNFYRPGPAVSANGRYVTFGSISANLVPGDTNNTSDVFVRDRQSGVVTLVSAAPDGSSGNERSGWPSMSADGRYVVFHSTASNLVLGDGNGRSDVFVHDRQTRTTTRVSVASGGAEADRDSDQASISADGRYVTFESSATNLVVGDDNAEQDVFVHDRQTRTTTRASVASGGGQIRGASFASSISADGRYVTFTSSAWDLPGAVGDDVYLRDRRTGVTTLVSVGLNGAVGDGYSRWSSISADGRVITFESDSSNLVAGDTNGATDVFARDRQTGTTTRLSVAAGGRQGNKTSYASSVSADGRYVAFRSWASNLVPGDTNSAYDVFVRDRRAGTTTRVSVATGGRQGNETSYGPAISSNGRYVAFGSTASNLVAGDTNGDTDLFVRDRQTATTSLITTKTGRGRWSHSPSVSANGRHVAFASLAPSLVSGDTNNAEDVFVRDRQAGTTTRVSVATGGAQSNDRSADPAISADGRYVTFVSYAANLVTGDTNGTWDVFVHDRTTRTTTRVSVATDGRQGDGTVAEPSISADGRYIAFVSHAANLVPDDTANSADVFVHDRATSTTTHVNRPTSGTPSFGGASKPLISADGRYLTFVSHAANLVPDDTDGDSDVFLHDQQDHTTALAGVGHSPGQSFGGSLTPSISRDGRYIAFEVITWVTPTGGAVNDVFVRDRHTGTLTRATFTTVGTGSMQTISADGRYIAFVSHAATEVRGDTNNFADVFLRDWSTGTTTRTSVATTGAQGNGPARSPSVSADGRYVAFSSTASNLVTGDTNGTEDVFIHDRQTHTTTRISVGS